MAKLSRYIGNEMFFRDEDGVVTSGVLQSSTSWKVSPRGTNHQRGYVFISDTGEKIMLRAKGPTRVCFHDYDSRTLYVPKRAA